VTDFVLNEAHELAGKSNSFLAAVGGPQPYEQFSKTQHTQADLTVCKCHRFDSLNIAVGVKDRMKER
jgi:hypothetical protein